MYRIRTEQLTQVESFALEVDKIPSPDEVEQFN